MGGRLWRRSQREESANGGGRGVDATATADNTAQRGVRSDETAGSAPVDLFDQAAPSAVTDEVASMTIARVAEKAADRAGRTRRGTRRPVVATTGSPNEPASPLVETFVREGARRNDELMRTLQRAQRTTTDAHQLREAVVSAEGKARLAAQRHDEVLARLEEERRSEEANVAQRRRDEAASLEQEARQLDQARAEEKERRADAYRARVNAAAQARADAQREARERATEARVAADRAEAAASALEAAVDEVVAESQAKEKRAVAEAEARARAEAETAAAELRVQDEQRTARIESFKAVEAERARERGAAADETFASSADDLAKSEARLRALEASLAEVEQEESNAAREVAACEAAVSEAESLAQAAREAETRARRAREARGAALDGARGATARATAARGEAERAATTAKKAAAEAAELIRDAERLSAEAREAEQQAVASARALESPGSAFVEEVSALVGEEIDLTDVETDGAAAAGAVMQGTVEPSAEDGRVRNDVAESSEPNRQGS